MLQPVVALLIHLALPVYAAPRVDPEVERLAASLTGSFSSHAQATESSDYEDVRLVASRIWTRRSDGPWIYVEQAVSSSLLTPYRQRILRIVRLKDGSFDTLVYALPEAERYIGEGARPDAFASITPKDLAPRVGCEIHVNYRDDGIFIGETGEHSCPSELAGAVRATSEMEIWPGTILSWDRGWNVLGEQVWGPTRGAYRFDRE